MIALPAILAGSGFAFVAWQAAQEGSTHPTAAPVPQKQPVSGGLTSVPIGRKASMMANVGQLVTVGGKGQSAIATPSRTRSPLIVGGTSAEVAIRQQLHALEDRAKQEYDKLSAEAKKRAADALNRINPSPGLTGNETFTEAAQKVGASIGAIAGVAACNAIPIPGVGIIAAHTVCASLGAIIGAYLGGKLGEWATKLYGDVKAWADSQWEKIEGVAEDVGDAVSDGVKRVGNAITGIF